MEVMLRSSTSNLKILCEGFPGCVPIFCPFLLVASKELYSFTAFSGIYWIASPNQVRGFVVKRGHFAGNHLTWMFLGQTNGDETARCGQRKAGGIGVCKKIIESK